MKGALKTLLQMALPGRAWTGIQSVRSRNHQLNWLRQNGYLTIGSQFVSRYGTTVLHGPFFGMKYPIESTRSRHIVPYLLGSYEMELHSVVEAAVQRHTHVIDIGSADGYYAVGFARHGLHVVTYETDAREARRCRRMAELNSVSERLTQRTWCSPEELRKRVAGGRYFILSDCEGYEKQLFTAETMPALACSELLIEIHGDALCPVLEQVGRTHSIVKIFAAIRNAGDFSELDDFEPRAISENREAGQVWLWCKSQSNSDLSQS